MRPEPAIAIGAGPAGLAVAATLGAAGVETLVVERADDVGHAWRNHYDRLRLHTVRWLSGLPGLPIPSRFGEWVARDDVVRYLEEYAAHHRLRVRTATPVERLDRVGDRWRLQTATDVLEAERVVVATGYNSVPFVPDWPGREGFTGELLHASRYRTGAAYKGRDVLVVGSGNTGAELAVDLVEQGASRVRLSVRTPPNILRRSVAGVPSQLFGVLFGGLPAAVLDPLMARMQRMTIGDLTQYGLPPAPRGVLTQILRDGVLPILDVGLVDAVKRGDVQVVAGVASFDGAEVVLRDGARVRPDVVVAATGYRRGLERLVGHLGVLRPDGLPAAHGAPSHPGAPGLYFIGYSNPIGGNLRGIGIDARRIARDARRTAS